MKTDEVLWPGEINGRPLELILAEARQLVEDPELPTVMQWRATGGLHLFRLCR